MPLIEVNYFENQYCKNVVSIIKDYNQKHNNQLPTISGLKEQINAQIKDEIQREGCLEILKDITKRALEDTEATQELAEKFCLQQSMVGSIKKVETIISRGDFEAYEEIITIMRDAMSVTTKKDDSMEVTDDLDAALEEDYRQPYATGIDGLDAEIGGGLAKAELGMLIIPTGVGKTTMLTKFANTAYKAGANVLQIFFEDKKLDIQRKHLSAYTHFKINDLHLHKEEVKEMSKLAEEGGGKLILKKCPSLITTVPHIVQYLRYLKAKGTTIDMLILDYIDCLGASRLTEDSNANEGTIIRQLESLTAEFNLACWTAAQGNRASIGADVVSTDQIQGSIKRAQVGHIILSVAKTMDQKDAGLATMAILKSRVGGDGKVFKDMTFQNDTMTFDTTESNLLTTLTFEENKKEFMDNQKKEKALENLKRVQEARKKNTEKGLITA